MMLPNLTIVVIFSSCVVFWFIVACLLLSSQISFVRYGNMQDIFILIL